MQCGREVPPVTSGGQYWGWKQSFRHIESVTAETDTWSEVYVAVFLRVHILFLATVDD